MKNETYQQIVDQYENSERSLKDIFESLKEETAIDPFLKSFEMLLYSTDQKSSAPEALMTASSFDLKDIELNIKLMYLNLWVGALTHYNKSKESKAVANYAATLLTKNTSSFAKTMTLYNQFKTLGTLTAHYNKIEKDILKNVTFIPRYKILLIDYALNLSRVGYANRLKKELGNLIKGDIKGPLLIGKLALFIQYVETGQLNLAKAIQGQVTNNFGSKIKFIRLGYKFWDCILSLLLGEKINLSNLDDFPERDELRCIINIHLLLKENKPKEALTLSKGIFLFTSKVNFSSFAEYTSLRVELANENIQAAKNILATLDKRRCHYLDNFFYTRISLLEGKKREAQYFYSLVSRDCKKFNAEGRLDAELDFSLEMKLADLRFLSNSSKTNFSELKELRAPANILSANRDQDFIGENQGIISVINKVKQFSDLETPVLITGETGTGKEVVAKMLHKNSVRSNEVFIPINCGAISESLLQSELFGHTEGSFTGATIAHKGVFETAGKGTVFLDEIGEVSERVQVALLRVLETQEFRPVGSARASICQCRIIAATNASLESLKENKLFRSDLFFRLKRLEIKIPPLKERDQDIILLTKYFLKQNRSDQQIPNISDGLKLALLGYDWPGNVRELKNEIEKMIILNSGKLYYELKDCELFQGKKALPAEKKDYLANGSLTNNQPKENIHSFLSHGKGQFRRIDRIKNLFREHKRITRKEIAQIEHVSTRTAGLDLKTLCEEKFIKVVKPTKSVRSHYFEYIE